jgi:hypothetical protein
VVVVGFVATAGVVAAATSTATATAWEVSGFLGTVSADALPASTLSFAFYTAPHLFGDAEAPAAASLVTGTRVGTSKRFVTYRARGGLAAMSSSLIEVTGEVTRGAELKVALGAPVLGIILRVLCQHSRMHKRAFRWTKSRIMGGGGEGGGGGGIE